MDIGSAISLSVGITALVTFGGTKLWDAYRMEKKFMTKKAGENIEAQLSDMKKRLILGNLIMAELCEKAGISESKIQAFESSLKIRLRDNPQT